jgi:CPA2 family monovalent cation:H+ antiporter-2
MQFDALSHAMLLLLIVICTLALFARINLPSVLGYLLVGVLVGPDMLGILSTQEQTDLLSEIGIVLMMFMIGLDFSWRRMRRHLKMIAGIGTATILATIAAAMLLLISLGGLDVPAAFLIAGAISMSSTAVISRQLMDQKEFHDSHGQIAFGITLLQDVAALVFLAAIPALAHAGAGKPFLADLAKALGTAAAVLAGLYFAGQKIERPLMRAVGALKSNEIFVLTTLLIIAGASWISQVFHLPTTIGAFLAGMIIGETEFKHKIEDDIRPFRDIMVGIFFIVMGLTLRLSVVVAHFWLIIGILALIVVIKLIITTLIMFMSTRNIGSSLRAGLVLASCDEFSLLLVVLGMREGIIDTAFGNILMITFVLSLMLSTLLVLYNRSITFSVLSALGLEKKMMASLEEQADFRSLSGHIILCGFGETGKNFRNILRAEHIPILAIDVDSQKVDDAIMYGCHAMYGDATSLKTLQSANIEKARALVLTFDNYAHAAKILHKVRSEYKTLPIIARVHHLSHVDDLLMMGATSVFSDGLSTSVSMRQEIKKALNLPGSWLQSEEELIKDVFKS